MAYLGDIIRTLKNGMTSMNESVNAVDRIEKSVPVDILRQKYPGNPDLTYKTPYTSRDNDGKEMTWGQKLVADTKEVIRCGDPAAEDKYAPGAFRIRLLECDCANMEKRSPENAAKEQRFGRLFNAMLSDKSVVLDFDFRECVQGKGGIKPKPGSKPWTYDDFESRYGELVDVAIKQEKEEAATADRTDKGYEVVEIKDFDMARKYGKYTGGPNSESQLCYTENESTMKGQFGGLVRNRVWLAYKPDFKDIESVMGEGCPYDEYGLSMIWVFVGPGGDMPYVNVRWNHYAEQRRVRYTRGRKATDHCLSMADVVEITGHDFKTTFLPYKVEEKHEIDRGLGNGLSVVVKKILRDGRVVGANGYNICHDGNANDTVLPEWVDWIDYPDNGLVNVQKNEKYNMFDLNTKEFVLPEWVDGVGYSGDGLVKVRKDENFNLFDLKKNEFVFPEWFYDVRYFGDGFVGIEKDGKWNLLDMKMKELVLPEWVDWIDYPDNGLVRVKKDEKYNMFDLKTKRFVLPEWFDRIYDPKDGFVKVKKDGKLNLFDLKMKELVLPEWVDWIDYPKDGLVEVQKDKKYNMFDLKTKRFVLPEWFDDVGLPDNGLVKVKKDGKWNLLDMKKNEFVFPEWVDWIDYPKDGFVKIEKDGRLQKIELSTLRKTESRRKRCAHSICECCGRRIR